MFTTHASYYFTDNDWDRLFTYTDDVRVGLHLPQRNNQVVPSDTMEFRWDRLDTVGDIVRRVGVKKGITMCAERILLGKQHWAFEPLKEMGTRYAHRDPVADIERGGFHITPYAKLAEWTATTAAGQAVAAVGAATAVAHIVPVVASLLRGSIPWGGLATIAGAMAPVWAATGATTSRNSPEPPTAGYTVKIIPGYSIARRGETICSVYLYRRTPLSTLVGQALASSHHDVRKAEEMAASMALSTNPEKARKSAVAMGLRAGLSPAAVRDTVDAATQYLQLASTPKNGCGGTSPLDPGPDPAPSAWGSTPESAARRLAQVELCCIMTAVACCKLRGFSPTGRAAIMGRIEEAIGRYRACWKTVSLDQLEAVGRAYWEWCSQTLLSSPTAPTWLSMQCLSGTVPPPQIP